MEPGNANYELSYGSGAIVDYLVELGSKANEFGTDREKIESAFDLITDHEVIIGSELLSYLRNRNDCNIVGIDDGNNISRVPTISFTINGKLSDQICLAMDEHKIGIRFGDFHARRLSDLLLLDQSNGAVRISLTHYNTMGEVEHLIDALDRVLK